MNIEHAINRFHADKLKKIIIIGQYLNLISSKSNGYSMIPVVGTRTRRMSCSVGR